ncbi:MAG TPA: hypothetical protein VGR57_10110 [Ktedonobacterales bacterium]|nr:hypothetical protein [Ktedonobacterales bacterium]
MPPFDSAPSTAMDAQQVQTLARSGAAPRDWYVWPLRRDRVRRAALGWSLITVFGFVLLVPLVLVTVPDNFRHGAGLVSATLVLLAIVGGVAFGGAALLAADLLRLARPDAYLLVITPEHYLKIEPRRTTFVPMTAVAYVTLKGVKLAGTPRDPANEPATARSGAAAGFLGAGFRAGYRREINRAPSLAFLDLRTNREVVVATDDTFEELPILSEILTLYARGVPSRS